MQYKICEHFMEDVEKKLNRIKKKCDKYGKTPFKFEILGSEVQKVKDEYGNFYPYKFFIVEVEGTARIDDWECVAVLEVYNEGNVVRKINTDIEIPERFKHTDNVCEHCNSKRNRTNLYIIHNVKTDEFIQVGSKCLLLYTGGLNAEYVAAYIDGITELEEFNGFVGGKHLLDVNNILSLATELIDKMGYFNSTGFGICTKNLVKIALAYQTNSSKEMVAAINHELATNKCYDVSFDAKDFYKDSTDNKVESIKKYYLSLEDDSNFISNVQVLLKEGYTSSKNIGFLAFLPEGYNRYLKKEAAKATRDKKFEMSDYFGEVSKRYRNKEVASVSKVTSWVTEYGETYLYMITLKEGNILMWKSSNWYSEEEMLNISKIDFTVKGHKEYKGTKQTDVTRCKFVKEVKEEDIANVQCGTVDEALNMFFESIEA